MVADGAPGAGACSGAGANALPPNPSPAAGAALAGPPSPFAGGPPAEGKPELERGALAAVRAVFSGGELFAAGRKRPVSSANGSCSAPSLRYALRAQTLSLTTLSFVPNQSAAMSWKGNQSLLSCIRCTRHALAQLPISFTLLLWATLPRVAKKWIAAAKQRSSHLDAPASTGGRCCANPVEGAAAGGPVAPPALCPNPP